MLKLYNSLSRQIEDFTPLHSPHVGMYTCGPTVYQFAHIGNFRSYMTADLLVRTLRYNKYDVNFVMNITDVGHLVSDADTGEDKLEKSAKKEGKTAWEVAEFYTEAFLKDYEVLHFTLPTTLAKATDHISEQIDLIKRLEKKGFTYVITDGVYFDTAKLKDYGKLSTLDEIKEGARVEVNLEKRNPRDFALWKFSPSTNLGQKRDMEWDSPWGKGFPGWHIECSAMSMKYLGNHFDIHTGGVDHLPIHHPDEIAQSEGATGEKFVNYWIHTNHMLVNGEKMSKSKGNTYRIYDLEKEGFDPMALRYLYLQTHYRQEMNFTFAALDAAQNALNHLREAVLGLDEPQGRSIDHEQGFLQAINNDLNTSEALAAVWNLVKADVPTAAKSNSLFKMDEILGLGLQEWKKKNQYIDLHLVPQDIQELIKERDMLRRNKQFTKSDHLRNTIKKMGYDVIDTDEGTRIKKIA